MKINLWDFVQAIKFWSFKANDCTIFFPPSFKSFNFLLFYSNTSVLHSLCYSEEVFLPISVVSRVFLFFKFNTDCQVFLMFCCLCFLLCVKMDKSRLTLIRKPLFYFILLLLLLLPKAMDRRGLIKWDAHFQHVPFLWKRMELFLHLSHFMFRRVA